MYRYYDRRQTHTSRVSSPKPLNPAQQARDIIPICKALDRERTSIFGNSGGGVIALQFAVSYPGFLDRVIVHEAPTTALLDDATYHLDRAFMLLDTYRSSGADAALQDWRNFWEYEFLQFTIYCPDLRRIVENRVKIGVAAGVKSEDVFYARTTFPQAEILACPRFLLPGHHSGFEAEPKLFAVELVKVLRVLGTQRPMTSQQVDSTLGPDQLGKYIA
ncbi:hypothetical protein N7486_010783 [Penicillium sp. IBT 16267x]|nr:hypothetical protein N7486_010783 [Penicillium sp. IBT 16267x]